MIYFDHNATTPLLPQARQAWLEAQDLFGNPSSPHRLGARADTALTAARERLGRLLGCSALDVVWTSGATESNNTVFHHLAVEEPAAAEVWISALEHPSVVEAARAYCGSRVRAIPATRLGLVDLDWVDTRLKQRRPGLVAVMAANNETGLLQPWPDLLALCREHEVPFFCDAAQWLGKLPALGLGECDFLTGSAHKFGGPKGVGFLKCPGRGRVRPLLAGGPQEEQRRAGTENLAGVVAMMAALEARETSLRESDPSPLRDREQWRTDFEARLASELPGAEVVGAKGPRLWNTVSALMPDNGCRQRWVVKLDKLGLAVSTGSACSSGQERPSHVLAAMGYTPEQASRVLRFSSGWETTPADWASLLDALRQVAALNA